MAHNRALRISCCWLFSEWVSTLSINLTSVKIEFDVLFSSIASLVLQFAINQQTCCIYYTQQAVTSSSSSSSSTSFAATDTIIKAIKSLQRFVSIAYNTKAKAEAKKNKL